MLSPNELATWAHVQLAAHTDEGGTIAGKYRVEHLIGAGGMGIVVSAIHLALDRRVAIKVLREELAEEESVVQRFVLEAKAAAKISNDHVCKVLDVGRLDNGLPFIVMELLEGRDLGEVLTEAQRIDLTDCVDWLLQACEGVAQAHAFGIVHRDLKPENLFLTQQRDGSPCLKILDFGISKQLGRRTDRSITGPLGVVGSPRYMAPEQLLAADVDERADIWALGAISYELLTGAPAFSADNLPALCAKVMGESPVAARQLEPRVPAGLDAAISRCLRRDREQRFRHVAELAHALVPYASEVGRRAYEQIRILPLPRSLERREPGTANALGPTERLFPSAFVRAGRRHIWILGLGLGIGLGVWAIAQRSTKTGATAVSAPERAQPVWDRASVAPTAAAPSVETQTVAARLEPGAVGAAAPADSPLPAPPKRKRALPAPSSPLNDGRTPAAEGAAPPTWTPQQAWDVRNFGGRQ